MSERVESLLIQMLEAQHQTNRLLETIAQQQAQLIQAMAEDDGEPDAEPMTYMDGTPVAPPTTKYVGRR